MKRAAKPGHSAGQAPSQRQLRAGELVRHALVDILRHGEVHDELLDSASVTVTEVRLSPDLRHAVCFVEPLGAALGATGSGDVIEALNRHARFLRGRLGREIDMKFTPDLRFLRDESFETAAKMEALFRRPEVRRDLSSPTGGSTDEGREGGDAELPPSSASRPLPPEGGDHK